MAGSMSSLMGASGNTGMGMNPYMMMSMMGGNGARSSYSQDASRDNIQIPNFSADYAAGQERGAEVAAIPDQEQARQQAIEIQGLQLQKAQNDASQQQLYQKGMDLYAAGDLGGMAKFAAANPAMSEQVDTDYKLQHAAQSIKLQAALKGQIEGMTYEQYQDPKSQALLSQFSDGKPLPVFKDQASFGAYQLQLSGALDKLGGDTGNYVKLMAAYKTTGDPIYKQEAEAQAQEMQDKHTATITKLVSAQNTIEKDSRPTLSLNDAFLGAKARVDNDPILSKLPGDYLADPNNKQSTMMGPKSLATTKISEIAQGIYKKDKSLDTNDAMDAATQLFKLQRTPAGQAGLKQNVTWLRQHYKEKDAIDKFENSTHLPASLFVNDGQ